MATLAEFQGVTRKVVLVWRFGLAFWFGDGGRYGDGDSEAVWFGSGAQCGDGDKTLLCQPCLTIDTQWTLSSSTFRIAQLAERCV